MTCVEVCVSVHTDNRPPPPAPWGAEDWRPVQTCSLENLTVQSPTSADIWWLTTEACKMDVQEVRILLEYFLVNFFFVFTSRKHLPANVGVQICDEAFQKIQTIVEFLMLEHLFFLNR